VRVDSGWRKAGEGPAFCLPGGELVVADEEKDGALRLPLAAAGSGQASTGSGRTGAGDEAGGRPSTSAIGPKPVLGDGAGGVEGLRTNVVGGAEDERVEAPSGGDFVVRPGKHRDMQVVRVGKRKLFDRKRKKRFLEWFAATGNCVFSAAKAGVRAQTVWKHRVKDAAFREAFDVAMEQGFVRAKARLLEDKATGPIEVDGDLDAVELVPPDPARVLDLFARIEARKGAPPARQKGRMPRIASNEEVEKALAKRLALFAKRQRAMGRAGERCQGLRCPVCVPDADAEAGEAGVRYVPDTDPGTYLTPEPRVVSSDDPSASAPIAPPPTRGWFPSPSGDGEAG